MHVLCVCVHAVVGGREGGTGMECSHVLEIAESLKRLHYLIRLQEVDRHGNCPD